MLHEIARTVVVTTGSITARLREDWQLVDVMKELNWEKYDKLGLTETHYNNDGHQVRRIKDWTKRNDHRHHAMDALTIAFTTVSHVQLLNNLNARGGGDSIYGIMYKELTTGRKFKLPMPDFRAKAMNQLKSILVSIKAKNKVATPNRNRAKMAQSKSLLRLVASSTMRLCMGSATVTLLHWRKWGKTSMRRKLPLYVERRIVRHCWLG